MTEKRFFILQLEDDDLPCIRDRTFQLDDIYGHYKYDNLEQLCSFLNEQNDKANKLEIDLEDMTEIKNKYKKEAEDNYEMFLDVKKGLSELGGKYVARGVNLRLCLQKHYTYAENQRQKHLDNAMIAKVYAVLRYTVKEIADELGVEIE